MAISLHQTSAHEIPGGVILLALALIGFVIYLAVRHKLHRARGGERRA